jgi:hypothetical protein
VTQLAGDPLRMFAGGEPPWRPGRPRLGEGAGPEAHPFPGCRPAPPPQRGDGDGPACLMQTALIAAPPRLPAGPPEPIVDRLEPLEVATTRRSRGPSLVLAGPSLAHGDCASHEGDVSPCERDRRVGTPARRACHMDIRPSVRGDLAHERRALLGGDGVDRRRWHAPALDESRRIVGQHLVLGRLLAPRVERSPVVREAVRSQRPTACALQPLPVPDPSREGRITDVAHGQGCEVGHPVGVEDRAGAAGRRRRQGIGGGLQPLRRLRPTGPHR